MTEVPCIRSFSVMNQKVADKEKCTILEFSGLKICISEENFLVYRKNDPFTCQPLISSPMKKVRCGLGGYRFYFTCPVCDIRTSFLYYSGYLACRKCHWLAYPSQNMSSSMRWCLRENKLLQKYGISRIQSLGAKKPKWMHKQTFHKLINEYQCMKELWFLIHTSRLEYKRCLFRLRNAKKNGDFNPLLENLYVEERVLEMFYERQTTKMKSFLF